MRKHGLGLREEYAVNIIIANELGFHTEMEAEAIEYLVDGAILEDRLNQFIQAGIKARVFVSLVPLDVYDKKLDRVVERYLN